MQTACKPHANNTLVFLVFLVFLIISFWTNIATAQVPNGCGLIHDPSFYQQNQNQNQNQLPCNLSVNAFLNDINVVPTNTGDRLKLHLNFIFVQKADGSLMFDMGDPTHAQLFNNIVDRMNFMVSNIGFTDVCTTTCVDDFISDLQIEFIPHFTHIQNDFYWNHENDFNTGGGFNSENKPFLNEIVALARNEGTYYEEGFDLIYTAEGTEAEEQLLYPNIYHWNLPNHNISNLFNGSAAAYSMFPSTDQSVNMQLHMTNSYRGYLSNTFNPAWDPCELEFWNLEQEAVDQAEGLMHEISHGLGLTHPTACGDPTNIGLGSGCERQKLNGCQINTIFNRLMTTNLRSIVDCEEAHLVDYIVDEDMTWSNSLYLYGDVIVKDNSTLTVTCELFFSEDRSIIVEKGSRLILDGALLTSMNNCEHKWRGIKVVGDDESFDFDVIVKNGTRIENAVEAINMFPPISWPEVQNFGNGTVHASNSFFTNNNKDISFIAFHPIFNNSVIEYCNFSGARESITNWNCQGVTVFDNDFQAITETSVTSHSGSFFLDLNTFQSAIQDVYLANSFASNSWRIRDNTFNGLTGILHEGGAITTHLIIDNTFLCEDQGMYVDGIGSFDFEYNDILDNEMGVVSFNTILTNSILGNTFVDCRTGLSFSENNNGTTFLENCFTDSRQDIHISGEVADLIGNPFDEAGNCFSDDKIQTFPDPNANIPGITGVHQHFTYFLFEDNALNCKDVDQTQYFDISLSNNPIDPCSPPGINGGDVPPHDDPWPFNPETPIDFEYPLTSDIEIRESLNSLAVLKDNINGSDLAYSHEAEKLVEDKINQLSLRLSEYYLGEKEFEAARNIILATTSEYKPLFLFSVDLYENDLDKATQTIENIQDNSEEWLDFKHTQGINIKFLRFGREAVNTQEVDQLKNIGLKGNPLSSYARGLYTILTGIKLTSPLPQIEISERSAKVQTESKEKLKSILLFPTVSNSTVNIETEGYEDSQFLIYNIVGSKMESGVVSERFSVDVDKWAQGAYIFVIQEEGKVSEKKMFIVSK